MEDIKENASNMFDMKASKNKENGKCYDTQYVFFIFFKIQKYPFFQEDILSYFRKECKKGKKKRLFPIFIR